MSEINNFDKVLDFIIKAKTKEEALQAYDVIIDYYEAQNMLDD